MIRVKKQAEVLSSGNFTRMCVSCNARRHKNDMIRVAVSPDKKVYIDETGKGQGRGCYVCRSEECVKAAIKSGRMTRSLKTEVPEEIYGALLEKTEETNE